ncbi:transcriptional regulator [Rhodococcus sp. 05-2255-3B1]|uniref:SRPBCC family protein n=1 Tax=unclassified Rhodococcus (in: high G+C Gram-positive bacteria) TaxID=192944 RepID=UPI000B9A2633|nr:MULTISPECIES: SRPBCC family protein [unclassified Rhodococcus (in: high G+C Gram-positive bacteria)]OZE15499.1 transcriptional regulator [Rhodococcus sp. 05-2255-3B1]OZE16279.1 transcriptional regulator [Rhodococcus sp. 05-2255-3C]OZE21221.1 transcriptional regulator [Rhodococcus sp. 05-2255-2A2]
MTGEAVPVLVERSAVVRADAATVHALIDDFHQWVKWSPYEGVDPDLKRTYSGPDAGVGASYSWSGNRKAGAGTMTITESIPEERIVLDLAFTKPFKNRNVTAFLLEPVADGTRVTWRMSGKQSKLFALIGKVFSMDKLVGPDFEKGLRQLAAVAEKS